MRTRELLGRQSVLACLAVSDARGPPSVGEFVVARFRARTRHPDTSKGGASWQPEMAYGELTSANAA
jgi:hypothetical protein